LPLRGWTHYTAFRSPVRQALLTGRSWHKADMMRVEIGA
jgi:hypothetical protein